MKWLQQRWVASGARRRELRALRALGESLPANGEIVALDEQEAALHVQVGVSLERDQDEYALVHAWARPLVVLRGLLDRVVLRDRARRLRALRREACVRLGEDSLETAQGPAGDAARAARAASARAMAAVTSLPSALREAGHFGRYLGREAKGQLVPRVPALAGLLVGWWIAQTFTDSSFSATLHSWGIGSGPRRAVSSETLRAMRFWLPLLAAALCSYGGSRLAALVRTRYSPAPDAGGRREAPR
jgi:hypothetical protein